MELLGEGGLEALAGERKKLAMATTTDRGGFAKENKKL